MNREIFNHVKMIRIHNLVSSSDSDLASVAIKVFNLFFLKRIRKEESHSSKTHIVNLIIYLFQH